MAGDVLVEGAAQSVKSSCLLQRAFALSMDSSALLVGSAPWDQREGVVDDLHPDSVPVGPDMERSPMLSKFLAMPHATRIMITCILLALMIGYMLLGRSRPASTAARPKGLGICFHVLLACISGFLRGYGLYVIGPFLTPVQRDLQLCFPCAGGMSDLALAGCSCPLKEFAVSSVALGAIFGGFAGGSLADAVGRRITLMISDVLFIASSCMMALSGPGAWTPLFFVGRVLAGLAVGASGPASHAYVSELVPPSYRGQLLTLIELALIVGVFTVFLFSAALGDERWRHSIEFPAIPAAFQLVFTWLFLHESPRWLASNGKLEEAERVVEALGLDPLCLESDHSDGGITRQESEQARPHLAALAFDTKKMSALQSPHMASEKRQRSGLAMLYHHRCRVALAIGCGLAHNALGANIVMYYSRDILQLASISNSAASQMSLGAAKAFGTGLAFALVDRCGRRALLIIGVAGCIVGHFGLAVSFFPGTVEYATQLAMTSLLLFLAAWDLGWASLMSVVITEVLPDDVRGLGLGASCSLYWLVSFVQAQTLETLFKHISIAGTFAMYGFASILGLLFVLIYVPETCGRPLDSE